MDILSFVAAADPVKTWTFIIVGLSFALYIGIGWWAQARTTSEFYVAGSQVSPLANGMATAAGWMSAPAPFSRAVMALPVADKLALDPHPPTLPPNKYWP